MTASLERCEAVIFPFPGPASRPLIAHRPGPAPPARFARSWPPAGPAPAAGPARAACPSGLPRPPRPDPGQAGGHALSSTHAWVHLSRSRGAIRDEVNLLLFGGPARATREQARPGAPGGL